MKDGPTISAESRRPSLTWALWLAFILLVVYPLSIGPALKLERRGVLPSSILWVYWPIGILMDHSESADRVVMW